MLWFAPTPLTFPQNMSDGYMSYHIGTFNHAWFFLLKNEKNALELTSGATFAIAKSLY